MAREIGNLHEEASTLHGLGLSMNVDKKKTLGLMGMYERALMMKGNLTIESKTGEGTKINLIVPLHTI